MRITVTICPEKGYVLSKDIQEQAPIMVDGTLSFDNKGQFFVKLGEDAEPVMLFQHQVRKLAAQKGNLPWKTYLNCRPPVQYLRECAEKNQSRWPRFRHLRAHQAFVKDLRPLVADSQSRLEDTSDWSHFNLGIDVKTLPPVQATNRPDYQPPIPTPPTNTNWSFNWTPITQGITVGLLATFAVVSQIPLKPIKLDFFAASATERPERARVWNIRPDQSSNAGRFAMAGLSTRGESMNPCGLRIPPANLTKPMSCRALLMTLWAK